MAADKETREVEILLNAQQANASIKDMAAGVALMNNQLAKMSQDDPRRQQLNRDFQVLTQRVGAARAEMRTYVQTEEEVRAATEKMNQENLQVILNGQKLNSSFKDMKAASAQLEKQLHEMNGDAPGRKKMLDDYHDLQDRIAGVSKQMGQAHEEASVLKQAMAFAGVTVGAEALLEGVKELGAEILNTTKEVNTLRASINTLTGATGGELDGLTTSVLAISRTFGKEFNEVLASSNSLSKQMGVSQAEALRLIQQGFLAGADAGGDFLDQVKEYAPQFKNAGYAADEFIGHISQASTQGIFSDKGADVVKEFGLRIREQTKSTGEALQAAFGADFTKEIFDGINNGSLTVQQALQRVGKEMDETKIPANQLQTVIADVFGGPGEDAGIDYLKSLKNVGVGVDDLVDKTNVYTQRQERLLASQTELAESQNALSKEFEGGGAVLDTLTNKAMTVLYTLLASLGATFKELFQPVQEIWKSFAELAESMGWVSEGTLTAKSAGELLGATLRMMFTPTRLLWNAIADIVKATTEWAKSSENARNYLQLVAMPVKFLYQLLTNGPAYFTAFSSAAESAFGSIGRAWQRIKDRDFSGAKEEFAGLGKNVGNAYRDAFTAAMVKKAETSATTASGGDAPRGQRDQGGDGSTNAAREKAAADAQKAREKDRKDRKSAQDKADQDRLNALKQLVKDEGRLLEYRNTLRESIDRSAVSDAEQRREDERQKVFDAATKKVEALTGLEADYTEQVAVIVAERDLRLRELWDKHTEEEERRRLEAIDKQIADSNADAEVQLGEAELRFANKLISEQAYQDAVYAIKQAAMQRELALIGQRDGTESVAAKKQKADILKGEADHVKKIKGENEGLLKFKKGISAIEKVMNDDNVKFLEESLGEQTVIFKAFKAARKTLAIAEIGMNLIEEMAENAKSAAQNPLNGITGGGAGTAQLFIANGLSFARATLGAAKIVGFAKGGATGDGASVQGPGAGAMWDVVKAATGLSVGANGKLSDGSGHEVAGIVHKNEYVIPEWMRADPEVMQVESWLERRRLQGYADGGATSDGGRQAPATDPARRPEPSAADQRMLQVLESLDKRLQGVEQWATTLEVVQDVLGLDRELGKVKSVRAKSEIRPKLPSN